MKKIIVEYLVSSQKTAILEDDKLIELLIEDNKNSKKVSNIYRGVVKKVIPGIQACFVDTSKIEPSYEFEDYFVYFGRLSDEKGIKTLIESMKIA